MKLDPRFSLCIRAAFAVLVACTVLLAFVAATISGTVKDLSGTGIGSASVWITNGTSQDHLAETTTGEGGGYSFPDIADGLYTVHAKIWSWENSTIVITLPGINSPNIDITLPFDLNVQRDDPSPTTQPVQEPHSYAPATSQVKYAQAGYNMAPIIQMNQSWKRASKFEPITFEAGNTYDPDGYIVAYEWTFGDGSMGAGSTVQHAYKEEGKYSVKLRVVDNSGLERSAYVTAVISNKPPVAVPGNDTNATVGQAVVFNGAGSTDPDGSVTDYEWSFGDGTTGKGVTVTHVYTRPDKYKAELKVTDDSGASGTAYRAVDVSGPSATPTKASSGGLPGIILLAGGGVACAAIILITRKRK